MRRYEHVAWGKVLRGNNKTRRPGRSEESGNRRCAARSALSRRFAESTLLLIDLCAIREALSRRFAESPRALSFVFPTD